VRLPDDLVECDGTHALGEGLCVSGRHIAIQRAPRSHRAWRARTRGASRLRRWLSAKERRLDLLIFHPARSPL
jgi:hypothetical protein